MKLHLALFLLLLSCPAFAYDPVYEDEIAADKPLLAVFGDSISTGVLANTQVGKAIGWDLFGQIVRLLFSTWSDPNEVQRALGNPDLAAATTRSDYGIREALGNPSVVSFARFGARAKHIQPQLDHLLSLQAEGTLRSPDYLYLMVGGNDFCSDETLEEFRTHFQATVQRIRDAFPDKPFIITPLPPVDQLTKVNFLSFSDRLGRKRLISCDVMRKKSCDRVNQPDAAERKRAMDQIIVESLAGLNHGQLVFASEMMNWNLRSEEVATDCFHPSEEGQRSIGHIVQRALATAVAL